MLKKLTLIRIENIFGKYFYDNKLISIYLIVFLSPFIIKAQKINNLDVKCGFRDLKLNTDARNYTFLKKCPCDLNYQITEKFIDNIVSEFHGQVSGYPDYIVEGNNENYTYLPGAPILKIAVYTKNYIIYKIQIYVKANNGSAEMINSFAKVFGNPNGIVIGWPQDFIEVERNDGMLFVSWDAQNVSLNIVSFNGNEKFKLTKRRGYIINYTYDKLYQKVLEETEKKEKKLIDQY